MNKVGSSSKSFNLGEGIPEGLSMALAQNINALNVFADMDKSARDDVIAKARNASSKEDMQAIVTNMTEKQF